MQRYLNRALTRLHSLFLVKSASKPTVNYNVAIYCVKDYLEFNILCCLYVRNEQSTPHEFIITGDLYIHLDDPMGQYSMLVTSLLANFYILQHLFIPTHRPTLGKKSLHYT